MGSKPSSLVGKAFWVLRHRPQQFLASLRGYSLFLFSRWLSVLFLDRETIRLGPNVRLQRLRCLLAERPDALISIGAHSVIYENAKLEAYGRGKLEIGGCAVLGDLRISCRHSIRIGARFVSSWNVFIQDFDPHPIDADERGKQIAAICAGFRPRHPGAGALAAPGSNWPFPGSAIEIGDDVWIGANATVLKGARVGSGSIIATGAVVLAGDYPARSLIAGNPAKVVKTL